jgi:hypothetical protein
MFPKLLANLSLLPPGKGVTNVTCSDTSTPEKVISQLALSRFLSHFRVYVSQGRPKITCLDPDVGKRYARD